MRRGWPGALSPPLPHPRGGPKRSGRRTQQSFLLGGSPGLHLSHQPSLPPQEFPSLCPLGDPQATPLPRWGPAAPRRGALVHQLQTARGLTARAEGRDYALLSCSGQGHGGGHSMPSLRGGEVGTPRLQRMAPGEGPRLGLDPAAGYRAPSAQLQELRGCTRRT